MHPESKDTDFGVVTAEDLGEEWPLTVPWVLITGRRFDAAGYRMTGITMTTPDGARYALNGSTQAHLGFPLLRPEDPVWADHPTIARMKRTITPLTDVAHRLAVQSS